MFDAPPRSASAARGLAAMLVAGLMLLAAAPAVAHTETGVAGGLISGLEHPIFGPDHLVAMIAVGLWGAILGGSLIWQLPIAFPLMMAFGAVLGVAGVPLPSVELFIALSAVALGLAVALEFRPNPAVAIAIVALFAIFHGHAHGAELPEAANPLAYGLGFVVATGFLHLVGILIGYAAKRRPGAGLAVVRSCGGLVAIVGCWFVWSFLGNACPMPGLSGSVGGAMVGATAALLVALVVGWPAPAAAHLVGASFGAFYAGGLHLLATLDAMLVIAALLLLAALQPVTVARWAIPSLAVGVLAAMAAQRWAELAFPSGAPLLLLPCLALLVLVGVRLGSALLASLGLATGAVVGLDQSGQMAAVTDQSLFLGGVAVAGTLVATLGLAAATTLVARAPWARIALRAAGSWLAAVGIIVLANDHLARPLPAGPIPAGPAAAMSTTPGTPVAPVPQTRSVTP